MSPYLLIDVGNTFLKWGRYDTGGVLGIPASQVCSSYGRVLHDEIPSLAGPWSAHRVPRHILISNVAGTRVRNPLLRALEVWPDAPQVQWIASQAEQCGVRNEYLNPASLGSDRWAALVATRALFPGRAALIAVCGTATTIDLLSAEGAFVGGAIMPGLGLMQRALHEQTAALPDAMGEYVDYPRQTVDAIASGCAHAQAGAVERLYHLHRHHYPDLLCIISGGAARTLAPRLTIEYRYQGDLVLEGLYRIAEAEPRP
ncbi:MAG: type III pantothenate kinase [Burkholderiaceae bacterium]|nr:type III pantothenate kinase [Burkholderiaceae bacterium]